MASTLELPFVRGIQAAGDARAATEFAELKLDTAHNVHVRPEHADVLYRRPGAIDMAGGNATSRSTIAVIGGRLGIVQDTVTNLADDIDGNRSILDSPVLSEVSTQRLHALATHELMSVGYADYSPTEDSACVVQNMRKYGGTDIQLWVQRKFKGVWQQPELLNNIVANVNAGTRRSWVFTNVAGGWTIFTGGASSATPSIAYRNATTVGGVFTSLTDIQLGALIWDIVPYSNGWVALFQETGTNRLKIVQFTSSFTVTSTTNVTAAGPTNPTVAGLVWLGGTTFHVWHGGYTADSDTVYLHQVVLGGSSTQFLAQTNACGSGDTLRAMSVGGGASVRTSGGSTEAASYCYVLGGASTTQLVGRLFRSNTSAVSANNNYVGAFYPRSRLWTSSAFYGARLFGAQHAIYGVWNLVGTLSSQGTFVEAYPIAYHSVTLGAQSTIAYDLEPRAASMWIATDGSEAKAVFWSQDSKHCVLSHIGYTSMTGQVVSHAGFDMMIGGVPRYYDGVRMVPMGIPQAPQFTVAAFGGGSLAAGTYGYAIVWEWDDARGRRQQSPAGIRTVVVGASGSVSIEVSTSSLPIDERLFGSGGEGIRVRGIVYRTDPGETTLNRAPEQNAIPVLGTTLSANILSFTDNGSITFATGEPLYTSTSGAGELASTAFEATEFVRGYSDRMVYVSRLFPEVLNYTKTLRQSRSPEANQDLIFVLPERITGLAYQDGNIYAFASANVWGFSPVFADDTGVGAGGVDPIPLATGVGCTQPLSIVETPVGVMFVGPRGVYMIARGGGPPQFIGANVEPIFIDYQTVGGAAHNPRTHEVCWVMSNGSDHRVVIYNYQVGQWFTWRLCDDVDEFPNVTTLNGGAVCIGGNFVFAQRGTTGRARIRMDDTATVDGDPLFPTAAIKIEVQSRDIALPGTLGGQSRVLSLTLDCTGAVGSALSISESHDSGATWSTERSISTASDSPPLYQFVRQKTRGVRFRLRNPTGLGPVVLSGVALRVSGLGRTFTANAYRRG